MPNSPGAIDKLLSHNLRLQSYTHLWITAQSYPSKLHTMQACQWSMCCRMGWWWRRSHTQQEVHKLFYLPPSWLPECQWVSFLVIVVIGMLGIQCRVHCYCQDSPSTVPKLHYPMPLPSPELLTNVSFYCFTWANGAFGWFWCLRGATGHFHQQLHCARQWCNVCMVIGPFTTAETEIASCKWPVGFFLLGRSAYLGWNFPLQGCWEDEGGECVMCTVQIFL